MYQLDNHKELALEVMVPYLLEFSELYGISENSGDRAQAIEDTTWDVLSSLDIITAEGIWLDYIGRKVGQSRTYSSVPEGAFTFGGTASEGFGEGEFIPSSSTGSSTDIARNDASFRSSIKAKIIQNNTDTSLDELVAACKLLFQASIVSVTESYPASISNISMYGSSLIEDANANAVIKKMIAAGVSLDSVDFFKFYNLFKNNAFIKYTGNVPETNDFELSFSFIPDQISTSDTQILSQNTSWASPYPTVKMYYNSLDGVVFAADPSFITDSALGTTFLDDGNENLEDRDGEVRLIGGNLNVGEINTARITRVGDTFRLYVNKVLSDTKTVTGINIAGGDFIVGSSDGLFFNSGSIYNMYIKDNTLNTVILNDALKTGTLGTNNGVKFI